MAVAERSRRDFVDTDEEEIVPWRECPLERLEWQRRKVREMGYCPCCENLDIRELSADGGREWPCPTFWDLQESARQGCASCNFLVSIIMERGMISELPSRLAEDQERWWVRAEHACVPWVVRFQQQAQQNIPVQGSPSEAIQNAGPFATFLLRQTPPESAMGSVWLYFGFAFPEEGGIILASESVELYRSPDQDCPFSVLPARSHFPIRSDNPKCIHLIKEMLDECKKGNGVHQPDAENQAPLLPTRVLEIVDGNHVRLKQTNGECSDYVTLSHRWGIDSGAPIRTTKETFEAYLDAIPWDDLNQTFQEALRLTVELGMRFLWIDALCIIQNDSDDWAHESGEMQAVYGNATLSLFAACDGALFHPRQDKSAFSRYAVEVNGHCVDLFAKKWHWGSSSLLPRAELFHRGWVFQEWFLCRRAVVLDDRELLWSCDHCTATESEGATPIRAKVAADLDRTEFRQSLAQRGVPPSELWHAIAEVYSGTELTFPTDRLPALSGLAKRVRKDFKTDYVAGCWKTHLPSDLMWRASRPVRKYSKSYIAPSWAWVSINGPIDYLMQTQHDSKINVVEIIRVQSTLSSSDPTGGIKHAALTLSGPMIKAQASSPKYLHDQWADTHLLIDHHRYPWYRDHEVELNVDDELFCLICCVYLDLKSADEFRREMSVGDYFLYEEHGVVLRKLPNEAIWHRIGMLHATHQLNPLRQSDDGLEEVSSVKDIPPTSSDYTEYFGGKIPQNRGDIDASHFVATMMAGNDNVPLFRRTLLPKATKQRVTIE